MNRNLKFGILIAIIVGTVVWLGTTGISENQTYYKTIAEVEKMGGAASAKKLRVAGDVASGSIQRTGREVRFTLVQETRMMKVVYLGVDPLPDTFRDGAQAMAEGKMSPDGTFEAQKIQAKCASKYEAKPKGKETLPINAAPASKASL
jgi:cytochrome c-type biogenesis protein CcmE